MSATAEVISEGALASLVKFVAIPLGKENESLIHWPCLQFENLTQMQDVLRQSGRSEDKLARAMLKYLNKGGSRSDPVVYLLGKRTPLKAPRIIRVKELKLDGFKCKALDYYKEGHDVPGFDIAWREAGNIAYSVEEETDDEDEEATKDNSVGVDKPDATEIASKDIASTSTKSKKVVVVTEHKTPTASTMSTKASQPASSEQQLSNHERSHSLEPMKQTDSSKTTVNLPEEQKTESRTEAANLSTNDIGDEERGDDNSPEVTPPNRSKQTEEASDIAQTRHGGKKATRVSTDGEDVGSVASPTTESRKPATSSAAKPDEEDEDKTSARLEAGDDPTSTMTPAKSTKRKENDKPKSTAKKAKATNAQNRRHKKGRSGKKTSTTSNDDMAPSFAQVRDLLSGVGYVFQENLYCRPGMDPSTNPKAKLASDFFESEAAFRNHLCAYGVNGDIDIWDDEEQLLVKRWVRYNIVKSVDLEGNFLPDYDDLDHHKALQFLFAIGCKYMNTMFASVYTLPGISKKQAEQGVGSFLKESDLFAHLSRFGLPDSCAFSQISGRDRLNLEMFLAEEVDTFEYINDDHTGSAMSEGSDPEATPNVGRRSARKRKSSDGVAMDSLAGVSKVLGASAKKERSSRKKLKSASTKKIGRSESSNDNAGVLGSLSKHPSTRASSEESMHFPLPVSPIQRGRVHSSCATVVSHSPGEENDNDLRLPETKTTDQEKLEACLEVLHTSYNAGAPCFMNSEDCHFTSNLNKILNFLLSVIRSEGQHGGKKSKNKNYPPALYICGVPGIGKTSGVNYCFNMAIQEAGNDEDFEMPKRCFINAGHMKSGHSPMATFVDRMCESLGLKTKTKSNLNKRLKRRTGPVLIVEIDEIDHLVSGGKDGKLSGAEEAVRTLLEWANDPDYRLAIIGISNSSGNNQFVRLHDLGEFKGTITFKPYGEEDILRILEARVGRKIIAESARTMIAKKVASSSGDARKALELASDAVRSCLESLRSKSLKKDTKGALVTLKHVSSSIKIGNKRLAEVIEGLPQVGKVILCVAATLAQAHVKTTTIGRLKHFVSECMMRDQAEDMVSLEDFKSILETLADSGLLSFGKAKSNVISSHVTSEIYRTPICLSVQPDDVESALSHVLYGQNDFYDRLREHAKQNKAKLEC